MDLVVLVTFKKLIVRLTHSIQQLLWVWQITSLSTISSNALVKIECTLYFRFPWTRNSLLIECIKYYRLVQNSRSWSRLWWLNMVWIGYSFPCGCSSPWLMVCHGMVCVGPLAIQNLTLVWAATPNVYESIHSFYLLHYLIFFYLAYFIPTVLNCVLLFFAFNTKCMFPRLCKRCTLCTSRNWLLRGRFWCIFHTLPVP